MQALRVVPKILCYNKFKEFNDEFKIGKEDLVVTSEARYNNFIKPLGVETNTIYHSNYGKGEPSDEMIDSIYNDIKHLNIKRIIAFGGGSIIDICKVLALDIPERSIDLFEGVVPPVKTKELIIIPTTCGTGSEVTNVTIAELKSKNIKKGLAAEQTYGDYAVLIPETLKGLPLGTFATSSIDALIHAVESYLSPKASPFTELFSVSAIDMIISGYEKLVKEGLDTREDHIEDFLIASTYAGIAFGNAGCAAVHALSYSIGGKFHVPHGEANYQFFTEVLKMYERKSPNGKIASVKKLLAKALNCDENDDIFGLLEELLNKLIAKNQLRKYGMTEAQIDEFTDLTIDNQQRLLGNNYVPLSRDEIREIFANLY